MQIRNIIYDMHEFIDRKSAIRFTTMFTPFKSLLLACLVLTVEAAVATAVAKPAAQPSWQAQWIWQEADGPKDTWLCLRKTVQLETKPEKTLARLAADSKYWLWINGEMVVFEGQLRRDREEETYYDVVDLAPYLKKGSNTLAALVWFWDKEGFSHVNSGKGGFLFEGDFGQTTLLSDATWKTHPHPAYEHSTTGGQPNMRLPVWNIRFNAVNDTLNGWQNQGYDDSGWKQAIAKGTPPSLPWKTMVERPFPQWTNSGLQLYEGHKMTEKDGHTIVEAYPAVRKYLALWKIGSNGLVVHRKGGWDWGDWGTNVDIDILDNCWYYLALKAAIPMAILSGYPQDTAAYATHLRSLETHFAPTFWKADERCYRSTKLTIPDDRANAMAVVAGLATPDQYPGILQVLNAQAFASPYSTLWEVWNGLKEGTINHGWNAPNTILSQYIAGLSPLQPGWSTFQVKPQLGGLNNVTQQVSTPHGLITFKCL